MNYEKNYYDYCNYVKTLNRKKEKRLLKDGLLNPNYVYYERHHIILKCCGGLDTEDNLILFTAREHFLAHYLLTKIYINTLYEGPLCSAVMFMSRINDIKIGSRGYSRIREKAIYYNSESQKGKIISEETKLKISISLKGKTLSEETKLKMSIGQMGHKVSKETIEKIANSQRGKFVSIETREKISKANKGKTVILSEESAKNKSKNLSKALKGKSVPLERRLRISASLTGRKASQEAIEKVRKAHLGSKRSDKSKEIMSNAHLGSVYCTNGIINKRCKKEGPIPEGFWIGFTSKNKKAS